MSRPKPEAQPRRAAHLQSHSCRSANSILSSRLKVYVRKDSHLIQPAGQGGVGCGQPVWHQCMRQGCSARVHGANAPHAPAQACGLLPIQLGILVT